MSYLNENKKLSIITQRLIPEHIRFKHPNFVAFVEGFFKYLEEDGNPYSVVTNILRTADIDKVADEYLVYYRLQYAASIPERISNDFRFFIKNVQKLFRSRGTEASFEFYFDHVFSSSVEFYYPESDILKLSSAKWEKSQYWTIVQDIENDAQYLDEQILYVDAKIQGDTSGAIAFTKGVGAFETFPTSGVYVYGFEIDEKSIQGEFTNGEDLTVIESENTIPTSYTHLTIDTQYEWPGTYPDTRHQTSGRSKLRDNYYYQEFSYVLQSPLSADVYFPYMKQFLHPAGYLMFGEVVIISEVPEQGYGPEFGTIIGYRPFVYAKVDPDPDHILGELHASYKHNRFIRYTQPWDMHTNGEAEANKHTNTKGIMVRYIKDWLETPISFFDTNSAEKMVLTASHVTL